MAAFHKRGTHIRSLVGRQNNGFVGVFQSSIIQDFDKIASRSYVDKWLKERDDGSKNEAEIAPQRALGGSLSRALVHFWFETYKDTSLQNVHPPRTPSEP